MKWLFICAHPDDLEYFVGHLMVTLARPDIIETFPQKKALISQYIPDFQKSNVRVASMTRGEMSSYTFETKSTQKAAKIRTNELDTSCKLMGIKEPDYLGFIDGFIRVSEKAIQTLAHYIEEIQPDIVVTPEPVFTYYYHPDHIRTGKIAYYAIKHLKESKKQAPRLYYFGSMANSFYFPKLRVISKIIQTALKAHRSQAPLLIMTRPSNFIASFITGRHVNGSNYGEGLRLQQIGWKSDMQIHLSLFKKMIIYWAKATMYNLDYSDRLSFIDGTLPVKILR